MFKAIWHSAAGPADQTTPKAAGHSVATERNPFDDSLSPSPAHQNGTKSPMRSLPASRKNSHQLSQSPLTAGASGATLEPQQANIPSGLRTPTSSYKASPSFSSIDTLLTPGGSRKVTPGAIKTNANFTTAPATTQLSRQEPSFTFTTQPGAAAALQKKQKEQKEQIQTASVGATIPPTQSASTAQPFSLMSPPNAVKKNSVAAEPTAVAGKPAALDARQAKPNSLLLPPTPTTLAGLTSGLTTPGLVTPGAQPGTSTGLKGRLTLVLKQARNLAVTSSSARPYVVISLDQNEFVSPEPSDDIHDQDSDTATPASDQMKLDPPVLHSAGADPDDTARASAGVSDQKRNRPPPSSPGAPQMNDLFCLVGNNPAWNHEVIFDIVHETTPIVFTVYDRASDDEGFLGIVELRPKLISGRITDEWYKLKSREDEEVTGEIRVHMRYERLEHSKRGLAVKDFDFLRMIGRGTFGRVFQVRKVDSKRIYAMKVLSKKEIVAKKEVAHTIGERKILQRSSECPFLLGLKFSFQSATELFLVMDYKPGGELFHHLQREGRFTEDRARFYTAEIVLAFEHLHKFDIVYRDLKPENILLDATGHLCLCDFGLSKPDLPSDALTNTFCGTTEYLAPEVLLDDHGYSKLVDFWSLGVLLFEMCCGWSPFYAEDTQQMYKNICFAKLRLPKGTFSAEGKDFVKGLLNRNPKHRLGAQHDTGDLKAHAFFASVDWEAYLARHITPPFKPHVESDESVANFDPEFTDVDVLTEAPSAVNFDEEDLSEAWLDQAASMPTNGSVPIDGAKHGKSRRGATSGSPLTGSVQDAFRGFSYTGESMLSHGLSSLHMSNLDEDEEGRRELARLGSEWPDEAPGQYDEPVHRQRNNSSGMSL